MNTPRNPTDRRPDKALVFGLALAALIEATALIALVSKLVA